jgi:CDP-glucose 4,6-dehydratase
MAGLDMISPEFWRGKKVFVTGHTGFKGAWLCLWLKQLGANVTGFALHPHGRTLFEDAQVASEIESHYGDIRNGNAISNSMMATEPEIVIHMAAQALVRYSYEQPLETYETNVMGLVNLFEAIRKVRTVRSVVIVTSDKCYENREWVWGYRENEPMGGYDPYSSSKGCAELVTSAYQRSYFNTETYVEHGVAIASARAGNVIGGGDWAQDRLVPDIMRAFTAGKSALIRNPHSIRPWQHALEPLSGYLMLAEQLYKAGPKYTGGWNFGPEDTEARPVQWIAEKLTASWGIGASWELGATIGPHEAHYLKLDCSKAKMLLGWNARWSLAETLDKVTDWYKAAAAGENLTNITKTQIKSFMETGVAL